MKIAGNWQLAHVDESIRFILYSEAYLQASECTCLRMRDDDAEYTWPNAAVTMMLAAHSVELFLKGAIISRSPTVLPKSHRIDHLAEIYFRLFPEQEFAFTIPFQCDDPDLSGKDFPAPSVLFRYPVKGHGAEWEGLQGFEIKGFLSIIAELKDFYSRIKPKICSAQQGLS